MIELFEVVRTYLECRVVHVIYVDFSKSFGKVPHGRVVQKVRADGIKDRLVNWIQNWVGGRK